MQKKKSQTDTDLLPYLLAVELDSVNRLVAMLPKEIKKSAAVLTLILCFSFFFFFPSQLPSTLPTLQTVWSNSMPMEMG